MNRICGISFPEGIIGFRSRQTWNCLWAKMKFIMFTSERTITFWNTIQKKSLIRSRFPKICRLWRSLSEKQNRTRMSMWWWCRQSRGYSGKNFRHLPRIIRSRSFMMHCSRNWKKRMYWFPWSPYWMHIKRKKFITGQTITGRRWEHGMPMNNTQRRLVEIFRGHRGKRSSVASVKISMEQLMQK